MKARGLTRETILNIDLTENKIPSFNVGDSISVIQKIKEGDKEREQAFEGDVIAMHCNGIGSTVTVRRIGANSVGIERIFPLHAPTIKSISITKTGAVRRSKLYYIRERVGKAARIQEKIQTKEQNASKTAKSAA